jgi:hypothetical protein
MALLKNIEIDGSGIAATYWRVYRVDATFAPSGGAAINVTFDGWADAAARTGGKNPVPRSQRTILIEMDGDVDEMSKPLIYAAAKNSPEFVGAEDI